MQLAQVCTVVLSTFAKDPNSICVYVDVVDAMKRFGSYM